MFSELYNGTLAYVEYVYDIIYYYFDLNYLSWLAWLLYPLIITLILPWVICILVYASAIFLHIYGLRHHLHDALTPGDLWRKARLILAAFWDAHGKIWHGYEIVGADKVPTNGPALLIYYHGALPVDIYYFMARLLLIQKKQVHAVGDRFLFRIPGLRLLMEVFNVIPGTVTKGTEIMQAGHLLTISPGGVREALFSDSHYDLIWGKRVGFAKIAIEAQVPIIPLFTQNCREAFRTPSIGRSILRRIYEKTRLPLVPIYGGFPVKLRTFVGDPIGYEPGVTAEELVVKVKNSLEALIHQHQTIPGTMLRALLERFYTPKESKVE